MAEEKKSEKKEQTVEDVFNTLTEDQKTVVYALIGQGNAAKHQQQNKEKGD